MACVRLFALDPGKPADRYLMDQWQAAEGLPSDYILSVAQTPDGYLWIATNKGLVRFDGIVFSVIPFAGDKTVEPMETTIPDTLFVDREGILWIGSAERLTSYAYRTGRFKSFTTSDGITKDRIRRIAADMKGNLWISFYSSYVNRFANGQFTAFNETHGLKGKKINGIVEDDKGNLLFGSRENGMFIFKEGKFSPYIVAGLENVNIITLYEDKDGELWIGTNNGLFRLNDRGTQRYSARDGLSNDYIISIIEDSAGNIWAGSLKGLNRIVKTRDKSIDITIVVDRFTITALFEDREKSLWIGTYNSGLKRLKEGKFRSYLPSGVEQENIIFSVFESRDKDIWLGAHGGKLFRCLGLQLVESIQIPGATGTAVTSIVDDIPGNLWLGTNAQGVFQMRSGISGIPGTSGTPGAFRQFTVKDGLSDDLVSSIYRDSRGDLWFSTFDGVSVRRADSGLIESLNSQTGLLGKRVNNVYEDQKQDIWIASDSGVTVLEQGKPGAKKVSYYLQGVPVTCIHEDVSEPAGRGGTGRVFWLATHGAGLKRLDLENDSVISFTTTEGMTTDFIYQFFEDQRENFWLMSNSGILRVAKRELNRYNRCVKGSPDQIECTSFGVSDGLKSFEFNNEFSRNSALKAANGELWFITKSGISIVNPAKVRINKTPPPVVIEQALFNDRSVPLHPGAHSFKGIEEIRFLFTAPTFLSPEKIKFKYQLAGYDAEWVFLSPGSKREAHYKDLKPGAYTFRVIACNSEGVWNRGGDSITFTLKSFFYETLLFKIAVLLFLAALLAAARYFYKKRLLEKEKKDKYKDSSLAPRFVEECIKKLKNLVENKKIYREADLTLPVLAEKLAITSHVLSQILNEHLNRNFADFINFYRIQEAKEILGGPRGAEKKIANVAFDVGFNTIVAFYTAFKKYTGMTPAQYKKASAKG